MSNQLEYTAAVTGFDKVDRALQSQAKNLQQTATAAVKYDRAVKSIKPGSDQASQAIINLGRVAQDAPFGFLGIANNIEPLLTSFKSLGAASGGAQGALKALGSSLIGPNGLILAFSAFQFVALGGIDVIKKFFQSASEVQKIEAAKKALEEYKRAVDGIFSAAAKERTEVLSLITVIESEVETRKRKLAALEQLKKINPDIFSGLTLEKGAVVGLDEAYKNYLANLQRVIAAKVIQQKLEDKIKQQLEIQGVARTTAEKNLEATSKRILQAQANLLKGVDYNAGAKTLNDIATATDRINAEKIAKLQQDIDGLLKSLSEFSTGIEIQPLKNAKVKLEKIEIDEPKLLKGIRELPLFKNPITVPGATIEVPVAANVDAGDLPKRVIDFTEELNAFFQDSARQIAVGFGEELAKTISGQGNLGDFFAGIAKSLARGVKELGKQLIQYAIQIKIIKSTLFKNPTVALAAGIALVAFGSLFEAQFNKQGFAVGTRFAPGGLALVGERGPELMQVPRGAQITPAAQTANLLGGMGGAFIAETRVAGSDLLLVLKRAEKSYSRTA